MSVMPIAGLLGMTVRARGLTANATLPAFDDWRRRTNLFKGLAAVQGPSFHRLRLSDRGAIAGRAGVLDSRSDVRRAGVRAVRRRRRQRDEGLADIVGFIVARRTREIAIHIAIGAEPRHVRRLIVRQTLVAAALGLAVGLLTGRWASAGLESLLYGIEAGNWTTPMAAAGLMLAITVAAALVPARRAARLEPVQASVVRVADSV